MIMTLLKEFMYLFLFTCDFSSLTASVLGQKCGPNEILDRCPRYCDYDYCPVIDLPARPCGRPKICPPPECKCIFNYRRLENGTCVPTTSCPPFQCVSPREEYNPCPPYCPTDSCSQATEDGLCPIPGYLTTVFCVPSCRCIKGYWRKKGVCVPFEKCKK